MLPNFLPIVQPIALFTVSCSATARRAPTRELIVKRGAGLSQWALPSRPSCSA